MFNMKIRFNLFSLRRAKASLAGCAANTVCMCHLHLSNSVMKNYDFRNHVYTAEETLVEPPPQDS